MLSLTIIWSLLPCFYHTRILKIYSVSFIMAILSRSNLVTALWPLRLTLWLTITSSRPYLAELFQPQPGSSPLTNMIIYSTLAWKIGLSIVRNDLVYSLFSMRFFLCPVADFIAIEISSWPSKRSTWKLGSRTIHATFVRANFIRDHNCPRHYHPRP